jgi:cell division protein FtsN
MKTTLAYFITAVIVLAMLHGCGPSEEELREQERARQLAVQDSLALVYEAQMEQIRQDSIAQARRDSIALAEERMAVEYSETGNYVVQIEAWRTESKANNQAQRWRERGFENAFVVQFGDESKGDVWYRVRFGRFDTEEIAQNLKNRLAEDYDKEAWVSRLSN